MDKNLKAKIREASERMETTRLYEFIRDECGVDGEPLYEITYCRNFAECMIERMSEKLNGGEWFGYELKALNALEAIPCAEYDVIWIDSYGFPRGFKDNAYLLYILNCEVNEDD